MRNSVKKPNIDNKYMKELPEKKINLLIFNSNQTRYKISFLPHKKIRKSQKVAWLKNHTD